MWHCFHAENTVNMASQCPRRERHVSEALPPVNLRHLEALICVLNTLPPTGLRISIKTASNNCGKSSARSPSRVGLGNALRRGWFWRVERLFVKRLISRVSYGRGRVRRWANYHFQNPKTTKNGLCYAHKLHTSAPVPHAGRKVAGRRETRSFAAKPPCDHCLMARSSQSLRFIDSREEAEFPIRLWT